MSWLFNRTPSEKSLDKANGRLQELRMKVARGEASPRELRLAEKKADSARRAVHRERER